MTPPWRIFVVIVLFFSFLSTSQVGAQAGKVVVNSQLELLSIGNPDGGGRVTWTLSGEQATILRTKILLMFDGQATIPRGFAFGLLTTGSSGAYVNNSVIDPGEALTYLNYTENQIEGAYTGFSGTGFRFVLIDKSDRIERDLPAARSTTGIVGTTASQNENIEIRFIFEATSTAIDRRFAQADEALVQALYGVFSFDAIQDLAAAGCPPACYPFPARDGWREVSPGTLGGGSFLWHGAQWASPWNDTNGVYVTDASNVTTYSTNGLSVAPVDLRFATTANFSFDHTGGTASAGADDVLLVQLSTDGLSWQDLNATGDPSAAVDGLPTSVLGASVYNLNRWLGQSVYLRLNFTANGDGLVDGPGFFLRNLRIQAPSRFKGQIEFNHVDYVVGFLSFSHFDSPTVAPHLIRTPVGEILYYNAKYTAGSLPQDTARYATFDFVENPQVLFVLLAVAAWLIGLLQDKRYESYRRKHPGSLRSGATKVRWLHWSGRIVVLLLVLFYFFPTMFGGGAVIGGGAFWVIALASIGGTSGFTWFWYERRARLIPPEPEIGMGERLATDLPPPPPPAVEETQPRMICAQCDRDIEDAAQAYKCLCGQWYHLPHAAELGTCRNCGRALLADQPPEKKMVTVKCPTCQEINVVEEQVELAFAKCSACGVILKEVPKGYNYLLIADEPHVAYEWFNSVVRKGIPGLCMSTTFPEKLRREYGLPDVELYWMSDTNPGPRTLDPKRLDFEIMRALSNFVKNNKGAALVLDGIEYLVVENSFDRVLKFIKKVNDLASVHDATMFVPVTPTGLGPEEMTLLRKEFDKVQALSASR